ncbi:MAG: hypothetical protein M1832_000114 [Thelocarpon impressellum]|nr:MAG: hypothetical protein M1832_000114 [Thelocarpon impressellum]
MTGLGGRQYIANLNTIPSAHDLAVQQQQERFDLEDELAKFTNTEFFDYDMGENVDQGASVVTYDAALEERARRENAASHHHLGGVDYLSGGFQFPDFPGYQDMLNDEAVAVNPAAPVPAGGYPPQGLPPSSIASPTASQLLSPQSGAHTDGHGVLDPDGSGPHDDKTRHLAEEDKRRRNTAASARFRVKKKQREQALERTVKEQTDRNNQLEMVINQLRMENKWLKNLVTEKNENKDDVAELWKKFSKEDQDSRSTPKRNDGVGTGKAEREP